MGITGSVTIVSNGTESTIGSLSANGINSSYSGDPRGFAGTQGINYTGSVWGSVIPLSAGFRKVSGAVVWAGPIVKDNYRVVTTPNLLFTTSQATWTLKRSFAVSLGKRINPSDPPPVIRRVWADGRLVYSNGASAPLNYLNIAGNVYVPTGQFINGVFVPDPQIPGNNGTPSSPLLFTPIFSNLTYRFYAGTETQLPDQALVADLGPLAPAFRGLMYVVIDGLIVGEGSQITNSLGADVENQGTVPPSYPQIDVELVDGNGTSVADHDFTMIDGAAPFNFSDEIILADWTARELAVIAPGATSKLNIYDISSSSQTACLTITGGGADQIGPTQGFAAWDKTNGIFYTERSGDHCLCSVNRSGAIVSTALTVGPNLAPANVDSTTITDAKPAIQFPRPTYSDLEYIVQGGQLKPVLLAGTNWVAAFMPSVTGVIPPSLRPQSFYQAAATLNSVKAFPLSHEAVVNSHLSYQDAAFVVATVSTVEIVYVSANLDAAQGSTANIVARKTIYSADLVNRPTTQLHALVDSVGNIVIQDFGVGLTTLLTKIAVNIHGAPDLTIAPTWRGLFPLVGATVFNRLPDTQVGKWEGNSTTQADTSAGTYSQGAYIVNLQDGTKTTVTAFAPMDSLSAAWDSVNSVRYFSGVVDDPPLTSAFGQGMRFGQVYSGVNGVIGTLGGYLRALAHIANYTDANLSIGAELTDQVPGVLITHPYGLTALFNDIGAVYDFTYFNSGGTLKFQRVSNTPARASGAWSCTNTVGADHHSVTIQDGDTATVGTFVYRFKTVPVQPFDVKISGDDVSSGNITVNAKEKTALNFLAALNADLTMAAADSRDPLNGPGFYAGTVKNTFVKAASNFAALTNAGSASITLIANVGGVVGNSIATTTTGSGHMSFGNATLLGGAEVPVPSINLQKGDLAFVSEQSITQNDALITTIAPFGQGQKAAAIDYYALEQDYIPASQTFIPDSQNGALGVTGQTTVTYNIPFIMSTTEAYARVAKTAIRGADNVIVQNFRLPQSFLLLEPSDIITVTMAPFRYTIRLDEATLNGDWSTSFSAANYLFRSDVDVSDSDSRSRVPQVVPTGSDGFPVVLDAPLIDPLLGSIPGVVDLFDGVRAYSSGFQAASLTSSKLVAGVPSAATELLTTTNDVKWGTVVGAMPTAVQPYYRTVEDTIEIVSKTIPASYLASASYKDFVQGKNCIAVGAPGNWEYIFFRDVVQVSPAVFRLTGLVRAQRGTDAFVSGHTANDIVLLLASVASTFPAMSRQAQSLATTEVGSTYRYAAIGQPANRGALSSDVAITGYPLYPFSPCYLRATLAGGNDLNLTWERRDRLGKEFVTRTQPMSEASERYDLDIYNGVTLLRTLTNLTTRTFTYTSAQQTADGLAPPLAQLKFAVTQKGELGRGFPRTDTVNVN